jgi:hypothetical protein
MWSDMPLDRFFLQGGFNRVPVEAPSEASATGIAGDACVARITAVSGVAGAAAGKPDRLLDGLHEAHAALAVAEHHISLALSSGTGQLRPEVDRH